VLAHTNIGCLKVSGYYFDKFQALKNTTVSEIVILYFKNYFDLLRRFITENLQLKQELHEFSVETISLLSFE